MEDRIFNCVIITYKKAGEVNLSTNETVLPMQIYTFILRGDSVEEVNAFMTESFSKAKANKNNAEYDDFKVKTEEIDRKKLRQILNNEIQGFSPVDNSILDADILE